MCRFHANQVDDHLLTRRFFILSTIWLLLQIDSITTCTSPSAQENVREGISRRPYKTLKLIDKKK